MNAATQPTFTQEEIAAAQKALNLYPDSCDAFWDSANGQDVLYIARHAKLSATNTNRDRIAAYAKLKRKMERQYAGYVSNDLPM